MHALSQGTILVFYASLALNVGLIAVIATHFTDREESK